MPGVPGRHDPNVTQRSRHENDLRRWGEGGDKRATLPRSKPVPLAPTTEIQSSSCNRACQRLAIFRLDAHSRNADDDKRQGTER